MKNLIHPVDFLELAAVIAFQLDNCIFMFDSYIETDEHYCNDCKKTHSIIYLKEPIVSLN